MSYSINMLRSAFLLLLGMSCLLPVNAQDTQGNVPASKPVKLMAAGSLQAALRDVVQSWSAQSGLTVNTEFAPSGLLRERIEAGEHADVFASANMRHLEMLRAAGKSASVILFARNQLCALTAPGLSINTDNLLDAMLDETNRVGTSTPKADPSGDYAYELFAKAGAVRPGAQPILEGKSLQLTGAPNSKPAPEGRNTYAWLMDSDQAEIFLSYCSNALLAQQEVPALGIVQIPESYAVGADYGLTVLNGANASAAQLALYVLSPEGQSILARYGFTTVALPR